MWLSLITYDKFIRQYYFIQLLHQPIYSSQCPALGNFSSYNDPTQKSPPNVGANKKINSILEGLITFFFGLWHVI